MEEAESDLFRLDKKLCKAHPVFLSVGGVLLVSEACKSLRTDEYLLKIKLLVAMNKIDVKEI